MKAKKVGIIRSIYYHSEDVFIKSFYEYLGYIIIVSKENKEPILLEKRCKVLDNYLKQVLYLKKKCNYIIVPHDKESKKYTLCPFLSNIETITDNYIDNRISYNINKPISLMINSVKITKNIPKLIISYILSIRDYHKNKNKLINSQKEKANSLKEKVLVVTNPLFENNIKSKYIVLYSKYLNEKIALDYSSNYIANIPIRNIKLSIGSIYYYHNLVETIYIIEKKDCIYQIKKYIKYLEHKIKRKIKIINI